MAPLVGITQIGFILVGIGIGGILIALGLYVGYRYTSRSLPQGILAWDMGKPGGGDYTAVVQLDGSAILRVWHLHPQCPFCLYRVTTPTFTCPRCAHSLVFNAEGEVVK